MIAGPEVAAQVVRSRAGHAFDPAVATCLADDVDGDLRGPRRGLRLGPRARGRAGAGAGLEGEAIDRALSAMGDFADLASPYLVGHSAGVAQVAGAAADRCGARTGAPGAAPRGARPRPRAGRGPAARSGTSRGRWRRTSGSACGCTPTTPSACSPALRSSPRWRPSPPRHHERLDGSGYHRGAAAGALTLPARLLAAADAYCAMTEPRPHREPLSPDEAAETLGREASAGRLDVTAVAAVLEAAGQPVPRMERPAGLTEREARGRRAARARPADQAGRAGARDLGQDHRPPHPERLREDRRLDAGGGGAVRDGARARGVGRTPDWPPARPRVASLLGTQPEPRGASHDHPGAGGAPPHHPRDRRRDRAGLGAAARVHRDDHDPGPRVDAARARAAAGPDAARARRRRGRHRVRRGGADRRRRPPDLQRHLARDARRRASPRRRARRAERRLPAARHRAHRARRRHRRRRALPLRVHAGRRPGRRVRGDAARAAPRRARHARGLGRARAQPVLRRPRHEPGAGPATCRRRTRGSRTRSAWTTRSACAACSRAPGSPTCAPRRSRSRFAFGEHRRVRRDHRRHLGADGARAPRPLGGRARAVAGSLDAALRAVPPGAGYEVPGVSVVAVAA